MKKAVAAFLEKKAANSNEIGIGGGVRLEKEDFGGVPALVADLVAVADSRTLASLPAQPVRLTLP